jgi:hypothetical protein
MDYARWAISVHFPTQFLLVMYRLRISFPRFAAFLSVECNLLPAV